MATLEQVRHLTTEIEKRKKYFLSHPFASKDREAVLAFGRLVNRRAQVLGRLQQENQAGYEAEKGRIASGAES